MTGPLPPKQKRNGYDDDDFRTVLAELDEMDEEAEEILASAKGKVSAIRKRQKNRIKIADKELQIPPDILRSVRKQRKIERQLQALAENVPNDLIEVFEDASGQFSLFKAEEGQPVKPVAQAAAEKRAADIQKITDEEQAEGAAALDELASGQVH